MQITRWVKLASPAGSPTRVRWGYLAVSLVLVLLLLASRPQQVGVQDLLGLGLGLAGILLALCGARAAARGDGFALLERLCPTDVRPSPAGLARLSWTAAAAGMLLALLARVPFVSAADQAVVSYLTDHSTPWLREAMLQVTELGGRERIGWLAAGVMLTLWVTGRGKGIRLFLFGMLATLPLELLWKGLVLRARPGMGSPDSFPSGHALAAVILAGGALALLLPGMRGRWPRLLLPAAGIAWVLVVGFARVYLGRHHPLDVLGGWLLGSSWLLALAAALVHWAPRAAPVIDRAAHAARRRRTWAWGAAVLTALVLVVGPWPLDRSGFQGQPFQTRTLAAIGTAPAPLADTRPGPLQAGYGERKVAPQAAEPLAGYVKRWGKPHRGVHDPCRVQVLALAAGAKPVLLVTGDLWLIPDSLAAAVAGDLAAAHGLDRSRIYFGATHTHSGPGGYGTHPLEVLSMGLPSQSAFQRLRHALTEAAAEALGDLRAAAWTYRSAPAADLVVNRVNPGLPVDPELGVLSFRQPGREIQVVSFSASAALLAPGNMLASGDYPGMLTRSLEEQGGMKAMFFAGAVGSTAPTRAQGKGRFGRAEAYARKVAERVRAVLREAEYRKTAAIGTLYAPVSLGPAQPRIGKSLRLSPILTRPLFGNRTANVQALAIDDVLLLGAPGAINGDLALRIKAHARSRGYRPVVTSFSGDYVGYLLPASYYEQFRHPEAGQFSLYGPHGGDYLASVMMAAADRFPARGQVDVRPPLPAGG